MNPHKDPHQYDAFCMATVGSKMYKSRNPKYILLECIYIIQCSWRTAESSLWLRLRDWYFNASIFIKNNLFFSEIVQSFQALLKKLDTIESRAPKKQRLRDYSISLSLAKDLRFTDSTWSRTPDVRVQLELKPEFQVSSLSLAWKLQVF